VRPFLLVKNIRTDPDSLHRFRARLVKPDKFPDYNTADRGASGIFYRLNPQIGVKYVTRWAKNDGKPNRPNNYAFMYEIQTYNLLEQHPSPYLPRSFLCFPHAIFLEVIGTETVFWRHWLRQTRDANRKIISVRERESQQTVLQWMHDLAGGAAWLESLAIVHEDIRPHNLVIQADGHIKLIDFGNSGEIGDDRQARDSPYGRPGDEVATHRTELFAIGTCCYFMTHGFEPYEDTVDSPMYPVSFPTVFQAATANFITDGVDPTLDADNELDLVVFKGCWNGDFGSVKALHEKLQAMGGENISPPQGISDEDYSSRRRECEQMVENGLLEVSEEASTFCDDGDNTGNYTTTYGNGDKPKEQDILKFVNDSPAAGVTVHAELPPTPPASKQSEIENKIADSHDSNSREESRQINSAAGLEMDAYKESKSELSVLEESDIPSSPTNTTDLLETKASKETLSDIKAALKTDVQQQSLANIVPLLEVGVTRKENPSENAGVPEVDIGIKRPPEGTIVLKPSTSTEHQPDTRSILAYNGEKEPSSDIKTVPQSNPSKELSKDHTQDVLAPKDCCGSENNSAQQGSLLTTDSREGQPLREVGY